MLYETSAATPADEIVIEASEKKKTTGFILQQVDKVLLAIRSDLNVEPGPSEKQDRQLMLRIRDHTNVIAETLLGVPLAHDGESATIVQLNKDISSLCDSVSDQTTRPSCVIL